MTLQKFVSKIINPILKNALSDLKIDLYDLKSIFYSYKAICPQMVYFGVQKSFGAVTVT